jgi:type I restriction enzyme S subunit
LAWGAGWPFVTPVDVLEDHAIGSAERSVARRGAPYIRLLPPKATLVVCIGSTIGKVGITSVEACTNQQINALVPSKNMAPEFVQLAVHRHAGQLRAMAGLQAVPIVNKTSFESMVVPIAPLAEQTEIASRMDAISTRIRQEDASATKMQVLKSGLMDDLLTGRVSVTPLLNSDAAPA